MLIFIVKMYTKPIHFNLGVLSPLARIGHQFIKIPMIPSGFFVVLQYKR